MDNKTVELTVQTGLCTSCGLCSGVCPQSCIHTVRKGGMYLPEIDHDRCVSCGICVSICPGIKIDYPEGAPPSKAIYGDILHCYTAWSSDPELRFVSASGGVVTTLVDELLKKQAYDAAFCVDSYEYGDQLSTVYINAEDMKKPWSDSRLPKSRYLPVSHTDAVRHVLNHREERVIIIGSPCSVMGWRRIIDKYHLEKEQYLIIGLFCDSVFNYNANNYYQDRFADGKKIAAIHFKNKESGGWPGDMKLFFTDGSEKYLSKQERAKIKDYFMPERCLYCIDKLNSLADISVGDNYTDENSSPQGSNSVIIRTEQGEKAWNAVGSRVIFENCDPEKLRKAQSLDWRENRMYYSLLKERQLRKKAHAAVSINSGIKPEEDYREYERSWNQSLGKLRAGAVYSETPAELDRQFQLAEKRKNPKYLPSLGERIFYAIKRRLK